MYSSKIWRGATQTDSLCCVAWTWLLLLWDVGVESWRSGGGKMTPRYKKYVDSSSRREGEHSDFFYLQDRFGQSDKTMQNMRLHKNDLITPQQKRGLFWKLKNKKGRGSVCVCVRFSLDKGPSSMVLSSAGWRENPCGSVPSNSNPGTLLPWRGHLCAAAAGQLRWNTHTHTFHLLLFPTVLPVLFFLTVPLLPAQAP